MSHLLIRPGVCGSGESDGQRLPCGVLVDDAAVIGGRERALRSGYAGSDCWRRPLEAYKARQVSSRDSQELALMSVRSLIVIPFVT